MSRFIDLFNFGALALIIEIIAIGYLPLLVNSTAQEIAVPIYVGILAACILLVAREEDSMPAISAALLSFLAGSVMIALRTTAVAGEMFGLAIAWLLGGILIRLLQKWKEVRIPTINYKINIHAPRIDYRKEMKWAYSERFGWLAFAAAILIIELTLTSYGLEDISVAAIGLAFVSSLVWRKDSRFSVAVALLSLVACPFLLITNNSSLAEQMAIYAYLWLVAGVLLQIIEYIRENGNDHDANESERKDVYGKDRKGKEKSHVDDSLLKAHIMKCRMEGKEYKE